MLRKFFATILVLFVIGGCVGTMKIAEEAPSRIKGATMQTKSDNNTTKK